MPLGTLDRTPPPFFRQGPSALTRLAFFSALALFLMVADARMSFAPPLRSALATMLLPVQRLLAVPVDLWGTAHRYLEGLGAAQAAEQATRQRMASLAERAARADRLQLENRRLRALIDLRPGLQVPSLAAEVLYEAADPVSRKVFIDRGGHHGVQLGSPVINEEGVLGQVVRVYPLTSEVALVVDREATIPVLNTRTQQRSAAFGGSADGASMELRYMSGNADVQAGDLLVTGGLDGVYPAGLPVATVQQVDRKSQGGFARITLDPRASAEGVRHVLVLEPVARQLPPRPAAPEPEPPARSRRSGSTR